MLYGYPTVPIWDSLRRFAHVTRLNDLFWWLIEETLWPNPHQKNYHYNVIIIVCVTLVSLLFWRNWKRAMLWVLGTALILSPVLHPWYCTWILPFATWRRAYPWHMLSVTSSPISFSGTSGSSPCPGTPSPGSAPSLRCRRWSPDFGSISRHARKSPLPTLLREPLCPLCENS